MTRRRGPRVTLNHWTPPWSRDSVPRRLAFHEGPTAGREAGRCQLTAASALECTGFVESFGATEISGESSDVLVTGTTGTEFAVEVECLANVGADALMDAFAGAQIAADGQIAATAVMHVITEDAEALCLGFITATATAEGGELFTGSATVPALGSITSAATILALGAATIPATAALTCAARIEALAGAQVNGAGALSASANASTTQSGAVTVAGLGTVTTAALITARTGASVAAAGAVAASSPSPTGDLLGELQALPNVVMFEDFSSGTSVSNYMMHNFIWTADQPLAASARRYQRVDKQTHPDAPKLLPWHKGALEIIMNGTDGESSAVWGRRLNDSWTSNFQGYGPASFGFVDEWWEVFSFYGSVDDFLKFWGTNEEPTTGAHGGFKLAITDKMYKQSTDQEHSPGNPNYRNLVHLYWHRFPNFNLADLQSPPGHVGDYKQQPGIFCRFAREHPLGLDPAALSTGSWPSPRDRATYGSMYNYLDARGSATGTDKTYSAGRFFSRDCGNKHAVLMVHTLIRGYDPAGGSGNNGQNVKELFLSIDGGDFVFLGGSNTAEICKDTNTYNGWAGHNLYGTGSETYNPSGQVDGSHHINCLTLQTFTTDRKGGAPGYQLNPNYPSDTPFKIIYAWAANREGRESLPAPGWVSTGGPISRYALPDFLPASLERKRLTTATNGRPRIIDANPADWGGVSGGEYLGYEKLPSLAAWSGVAWDREKHTATWWAASGHATGWNNGIFIDHLQGRTQPHGVELEDISSWLAVKADIDALAENQAIFVHNDGRPASVHPYCGLVKIPGDKRIFRHGGSANRTGANDSSLRRYILGSKSSSGYAAFPHGMAQTNGMGCLVDERAMHLLLFSFESLQYRAFDLNTETMVSGGVRSMSGGGFPAYFGHGVSIVWDRTRRQGITAGALSSGSHRKFVYDGAGGLTFSTITFSGPGAARLAACEGPSMAYSLARDRIYAMDISSPNPGTNANYCAHLLEIHPTTFDVQQYTLGGDAISNAHSGVQWSDLPRLGMTKLGELENWPNHLAFIDRTNLGPVLVGLP